ncbi:uncharacterized protein LOC113237983 [Hyposmocoma kahamanoa]|uniref:uncharacterized protein LOC113237983 n=1 Tax=Hyposmocoma kahamanoa TaxID=1477025 RepID=UPI000E6D67DE|nr:uncharacterized protein LOC113237983 [Hyposmocoma kahamanoa]
MKSVVNVINSSSRLKAIQCGLQLQKIPRGAFFIIILWSILRQATAQARELKVILRSNARRTLDPSRVRVICEIETLSDSADDQLAEREEFECQYHALVAAARSLPGAQPAQHRERLDGSVSSFEDAQASGLSNRVRLPKINLPVFHGHYQHWLEFRTFVSLIHCRFWCDSMIVLGWLYTSPTNLKSFVRNRVHGIQESTESYTSKDNPADLVSRGLKADLISDSSLWWSGPPYLSKMKLFGQKCPTLA